MRLMARLIAEAIGSMRPARLVRSVVRSSGWFMPRLARAGHLSVNADRIRTSLLDAEHVAARAQARGLATDDYYRANLLGREVTVEDVADAFLALALAQSTTASVVTVDGGNIAAAPR